MYKKLSRLFVLLVVIITIVFFVLRSPDKTIEEIKYKYANDASEYVDIEGVQVHYRVEGSGPPLVLIHGTGASLHTWDVWTRELQDQFTIYRLDLPAFGLTGPSGDRDYSMENFLDFVHGLTTHVGLDTFAIAGNSLGGNIAWRYALAHPSRVSRLILIDASGYPLEKPTEALAIKIAQHPILSPLMLHITPKSFVRKNLEQVYGDPAKVTDELVDRYHDMTLRQGNRRAFVDRANTVFTDQSKEIKDIQCPTLILWGAKDTWVPPVFAHRFDKEITNSDLIMYPTAGHIPMEEIPMETAGDVRKWLTVSGYVR